MLPDASAIQAEPPPFYIYPEAAYNFKPLLDCWPTWRLDDQAGEAAMLDLLEHHPARVLDPALARLFVVPVMPYISAVVKDCDGEKTERRMARAANALRRSPWLAKNSGHDHMIITHTFRANHLRGMKEVLSNATVAWFEHPLAKKRGPSAVYRLAYWRCTVTLPYLANPHCADLRSSEPLASREPGSAFFQGTLDVAKQLRGQFYHFMNEPWARIRNVNRNITRSNWTGEASDLTGTTDVSAFTKVGTARQMLRSEFCLTPKGDTPTSGRFFHAMACGCIPVVISDLMPGHLPFDSIVNYKNLAVFVDEFGFLELPREYLMKALKVAQPKAARIRSAIDSAAKDLMHFAPGSRVATNLLLQWQHSCEPAESPPLKPQKLIPAPGSYLQMRANGLACGAGPEAATCKKSRTAKIRSGAIKLDLD